MKIACLIAICVAALAASSTANTAVQGNFPDPPLNAFGSTGPILKNGTVRMLVMARSATDMPVPYVKVYVRPCGAALHRQFHIKLGRRLDSTQETVTMTSNGRSLVWKMFSAPANTDLPARLPLNFVTDDGKKTQYFCIAVRGWTDEGTKFTDEVDYIWGNA